MSERKTPFHSLMGEEGMLLDFLIEHKGESLTFVDLNPVDLIIIYKESLINRWRDEGIIDYSYPEFDSGKPVYFKFVPTRNERTKGLYEYYTATINIDDINVPKESENL